VAGLTQANAIQTAIRTAVQVGTDLSDVSGILNSLNRAIAGRSDRQLVTCSLVTVDVSAGRIAYVNAGGMPPLLLAGPGRLITLDHSSLLLGVDGDYVYETTSVDLPPSFRLVCHSDGLLDAANAAGEVFGERRLHELLLDRAAFAEPAALVQRASDALSSHLAGQHRDDDATLLVLGRG
jgi:serine phosphatase RsbU (regulator of sigma subunit)